MKYSVMKYKRKNVEEKCRRCFNIDRTSICFGTIRLINRRPRVINRQSRVLRGERKDEKERKRRNFDSHYRYGISERDDWNFNGGFIIFRRRRTRVNARWTWKKNRRRGASRGEKDGGERTGVKTSGDWYHREHCEARIDHNYCPH